jgi:hypothetical protein
MVVKFPAKKKLLGSKIDEIVFLLGAGCWGWGWGFRYNIRYMYVYYICTLCTHEKTGWSLNKGTGRVAIESKHKNR